MLRGARSGRNRRPKVTSWELIQKLRTVRGDARVCLQIGDGKSYDEFQIVAEDDGTIALQTMSRPEPGDELLTQEE